MIVCHCTQISDHDILAAIDWMRKADPETIITPGKIYHALGKRAECGGCMPLFLDTMRHCANLQIPMSPALSPHGPRHPIPVLAKGRQHEGRPQGH